MKLELNEQERQLLKNVLHALYKTFRREPGMNIGTCQCTNVYLEDVTAIIAIHDRLASEDLSGDSGYFVICRVHRDDLEAAGLDASGVDDATMERLATKMGDDYLTQLYWEHLPEIAESLGIPGKDGGSADEEEEAKNDIDKAVDYVRKNMDEDDLTIIRAKVSKNLKSRNPAWYHLDCGEIERLLYEYGEANGLTSEDADGDWWESECDIDDILLKL